MEILRAAPVALNDVLILTVPDPNDIKQDLCKYLDAINAEGDFATMKSTQMLVPPQVRINGNEIEVPLGAKDAQKIIDAAHQAPFGRGTETIVDANVRNTWELNPTQFTLDPQWQSYIDGLTKTA